MRERCTWKHSPDIALHVAIADRAPRQDKSGMVLGSGGREAGRSGGSNCHGDRPRCGGILGHYGQKRAGRACKYGVCEYGVCEYVRVREEYHTKTWEFK